MIPHPNTRRNAIQQDCDCQACTVQRARRDALDTRLAYAAVIMAVILFIAIPALRSILNSLPASLPAPSASGDAQAQTPG